MTTGGNHKIPLGQLTGLIVGALARIGRQVQRPQPATRSFSTVIPPGQPIRCAITVAGMRGYSPSSWQIAGS
jgi:hypothetical protein